MLQPEVLPPSRCRECQVVTTPGQSGTQLDRGPAGWREAASGLQNVTGSGGRPRYDHIASGGGYSELGAQVLLIQLILRVVIQQIRVSAEQE